MAQRNSYTLEYAPIAYDDLDGIFAYIAGELESPDNAYGQILRIEEAILALRDLPYRVALARDATLAQKGLRMLVVDNYAIFFIIIEERKALSIRRVLYGRRNFQWLV